MQTQPAKPNTEQSEAEEDRIIEVLARAFSGLYISKFKTDPKVREMAERVTAEKQKAA